MLNKQPEDEDFWEDLDDLDERCEPSLGGSTVWLQGFFLVSLDQLFATRRCLWLCLDRDIRYGGWMHQNEIFYYVLQIEAEIWKRKKAEPPKEPGLS